MTGAFCVLSGLSTSSIATIGCSALLTVRCTPAVHMGTSAMCVKDKNSSPDCPNPDCATMHAQLCAQVRL